MTINHEELRKRCERQLALGAWDYMPGRDEYAEILALLDEIAALKRDHAEEIALIDKLVQGK